MNDKINIGTIIKFGKYDWRVLDKQDNKALILSEKDIAWKMYNGDYANVTWETSIPRKFLNENFIEKFKKEQDRIIETHIINNNNYWYNTPGGRDTDDKIFLLSIEEVDKYFGDSGDYQNKRRKKNVKETCVIDNNGFFISNEYDSDRKIKSRFFSASSWWLRTPGQNSCYAAFVLSDGLIGVYGAKVGTNDESNYGLYALGVRPALWLAL